MPRSAHRAPESSHRSQPLKDFSMSTPFSLSPLLPSGKMLKAKPFGCPDGQPCPFFRLGASQGRENGSEVQGQDKDPQTALYGLPRGRNGPQAPPRKAPLRFFRPADRSSFAESLSCSLFDAPQGLRTPPQAERCSPSRCLHIAAPDAALEPRRGRNEVEQGEALSGRGWGGRLAGEGEKTNQRPLAASAFSPRQVLLPCPQSGLPS